MILVFLKLLLKEVKVNYFPFSPWTCCKDSPLACTHAQLIMKHVSHYTVALDDHAAFRGSFSHVKTQ